MSARTRIRRTTAAIAVLLVCFAGASAAQDLVFRDGFEPAVNLDPAPVVFVLRDDRVATVEMDYNRTNPTFQFWEMSGNPSDDAGFLVQWWPLDGNPNALDKARALRGNDGEGCLNPDYVTPPKASAAEGTTPPGLRWLVTGNRRVQLQPLDNARQYAVKVERINALGQITSLPAQVQFAGGDPTRVNQLRAALTYLDDFNLPMGAVDERLWNNGAMVSTDPRYNQFFINDQFHVHSLHGTRVETAGDKSQTSQRFRKRMRIQAGQRRRVVFDMDSPLSPRSVWYLDLNPVPTEVTAHASFFDEEGDSGLPAGALRVRVGGQELSVSMIDARGASYRIARVDMAEVGRQAVSNVRRSFDLRVGTDGIQIFIDGQSVIDKAYIGEFTGQTYTLAPGDYEALWVAFGYNTTKDGVPYYLLHWDNFGFDGPVVDATVVHDYVTRIEGTDYRKASRGNNQAPTFTIRIPDDLRPTRPDATAEAWLVATYQMGDYSWMSVLPTDTIRINGGPSVAMQPPRNNSSNPALDPSQTWGLPYTARVRVATITQNSTSPLVVGDNTFQFFADNVGLLNVHLEVIYPTGSQPAYTRPSAIHHFPLHAELPRFGTPARIHHIGTNAVEAVHVFPPEFLQPGEATRITVSGTVDLDMEVGNSSWATSWAPQLMNVPVQSVEVWSTGGTAGIARVEVFLRPVGSTAPPGQRVLALETAADAPAPQGRYKLAFDSRAYPNGEYELFLQATSPSGLKSHPSYGDEIHQFGSENLSGAYRPVRITIQN